MASCLFGTLKIVNLVKILLSLETFFLFFIIIIFFLQIMEPRFYFSRRKNETGKKVDITLVYFSLAIQQSFEQSGL